MPSSGLVKADRRSFCLMSLDSDDAIIDSGMTTCKRVQGSSRVAATIREGDSRFAEGDPALPNLGKQQNGNAYSACQHSWQ